MAVGAGDYALGIATSIITILVLTIFHVLENYLEKLHDDKLYSIVFTNTDYDNLLALEETIKEHHLKSFRKKISKDGNCLEAAIMVTGHKKHIGKLDRELLLQPNIKSF